MIHLFPDPKRQVFLAKAKNGRVIIDRTILSAIYISLFTNARSPDVEDPRLAQGHWADAWHPGDPIGSLLWTLRGERLTPEVGQRAENHCRNALQWMISDGHIRSLTTSHQIQRGFLRLTLQITLPDGGIFPLTVTPNGPA